MADDNGDCDCMCSNITIMQLFHELKQKFPYVPDRVVNECIRKNGHDKGACECALEKENRAYLLHSYPPGLASRMSSEENFGPNDDSESCYRRFEQLRLPVGNDFSTHLHQAQVSDFDRRLPGRQSLDSLCRKHRARKSVTFKHYSDEYLHQPSNIIYSNENNPRSNEETSCAARLPFMTCNYNSDDLNLTFVNGRGPSDDDDGIDDVDDVRGHNCQNTFSDNNAMPIASTRDHGRPLLNRPASLVNETGGGVGGSGAGDLRLEFASDVKSCRCERTSVSVVSSCSVDRGLPAGPHSAPVTPSGYQPPLFPPLSLDVTTQRHRTALSVEPSPPYMTELDSPSQRPFTRVNLTLRPPSSDPQPPIDIRSSAGGGLTYSTCSYDPRQGYQSRLRISIGPGGQGSVSAARTKTATVAADQSPSPALKSAATAPSSPSTSIAPLVTDTGGAGEPSLASQIVLPELLEPATQAIVNEQLRRKQRLEKELAKEKERLRIMQQDVAAMERDLNSRQSKINKRSKVQQLKEEIGRLFAECRYMTAEVDISLPIPVPLGETREDFYRNIYRGQKGRLQPESHFNRGVSNDPRNDAALGAGPSSLQQHHPARIENTPRTVVSAPPSGSDGPNWTCNLCTFRNHPLLDTCEQCEMPRGVFGPRSETQNIHIHVTHHNFPSRRVAHSWVV